MTKWLAHSWIFAPIGAAVYLIATVLFWQTPTLPPRQKLAEIVRPIGPSWNFINPEIDRMISELKTDKKSVQTRQQQLDDLDTRVHTERAELSQVIQSVRALQSNFDNAVLRVQDQEVGNLKKLAKVYAAMSPDTAANVLEQLDNQAIVKIMLYLKNEEAAAILESMAKKSDADARRTAQISEQIRLSAHNSTTQATTQ